MTALASLAAAGAPKAAGDDGAATAAAAVAILGKPALVTAAPPSSAAEGGAAAGTRVPPPGSSAYVELSVLGFTPPARGGVQAVVGLRGKEGGPVQELGRFGIFPNEAFKADDPAQAQRFVFRIPQEKVLESVREGAALSIDLVPYGGSGEGARLELGQAEIRRR